MSIASPQRPRTIADMLVALGDFPPERVWMIDPRRRVALVYMSGSAR